MAAELADTTWTEVAATPLVLVPVGSIEQHGPHLPLDTDTAIAVAVAEGVAERLGGDVLVAPPVSYGSSGEHQSFAGTCSIGSEALRTFVIELVRSMSTWAGRIVFVNAHGGNVAALAKATFQMIVEEHDVSWAACATEGVDLHAGITETSLMLHIRPGSVRLDRAEAGEKRPLAEILPLMMAGGVGAVSPNGVLGDPAGATAENGAQVLEDMIAEIAHRIRDGVPDARGMLALSPMARTQ
ncbi:mycofactocin biosynthesis peptidyl-dipeptidase MftE [Aeromicrobium sp. SMF47]|uniref:Mycofactocin biosynthesis peptidyl-dipeptidase MftE n=1 Tax=Aeromicrobium yanjiei TaxID=2662028 RepID=A0A5Q2MBD7_9ACTN|nr:MULTISPECIES: mycofactocin biosynthesis peptidyl-dipeptidase MftE [Aeromicrobium]MRJ75133.1 mycofactocin biosynthesis peptidyl-dipeptidase MftE [Aeromicrobium yanjiei]MRK02810.1 mycofactocin biosynthesis peptidyl-dipeptidase MftE [Aeromicrobium sp. S22]QGG40404.1 mycofactocin biosynthesis peptidyl-dipeptidase MftE [Aeromicrobium yanjiei]